MTETQERGILRHEQDAFPAARSGRSRSRSLEGDDLFAARGADLPQEPDRASGAADRQAAAHAVRRSSEKVERQIEQLELKLEELEANRAELAPEPPAEPPVADHS